jgi:ribosomal-protein-alanine N-acetyltransferase
MEIEPMTSPSDRLLTERLLLRRPVRADAAVIAREYGHDPDVTKYLLFRPDQPDHAIEEFIAKCIAEWEQEKAFAWVIERRDTGELAGMIDARVDSYMVNVGYVLARRQWGQGFASEALRAVVAWADQQPDITRLWAVCAVENEASAHVLEKGGLQREAYLAGHLVFPNLGPEPHDCLCYARVKM